MPLRISPARLYAACLAFALVLPAGSGLQAQSFKASDLAPAPQAARADGLNAIVHDYWEQRLERSPELASAVGDNRFDEQLSDDSPEAYNDALAKDEELLERLGAIDPAGLTPEDRLRKHLLVEKLVDRQESADCKPWQTPVSATSGPQVELPELVEVLPFRTAEDYDHYVARLNRVPRVFEQVGTDMMLGEQAGRVVPAPEMQQVLGQISAVAAARPEETPFARPLNRFPAGLAPAAQAEIRARTLQAIRTQVQPAYARFAKFLRSEYIPKAGSKTAPCTPLHAGTLQILSLRIEAQKALGKDFDLRAFHDEVLQDGAVPADTLDRRIHRWIAQHATH